jgi:hypothetical protein
MLLVLCVCVLGGFALKRMTNEHTLPAALMLAWVSRIPACLSSSVPVLPPAYWLLLLRIVARYIRCTSIIVKRHFAFS